MEEVNGCGCGSGLLKHFKPPYAKFFKTECNAHDAAYDAGGTEADRRAADKWLFCRMSQRVVSSSLSPFAVTARVLVCLLYYVSVRVAGRHYFLYR